MTVLLAGTSAILRAWVQPGEVAAKPSLSGSPHSHTLTVAAVLP